MFGLLKSKKDKYDIIIESEEWSSQQIFQFKQ